MQAAAQVASPDFDWSCIDTVLLDMDGTILDLHYDNWVWDEALPAAFGQLSGRTKEDARQVVRDQMQVMSGSIRYFSFDYWSEFTGVDVVALHHESRHLIDFRQDAETFLEWLADGHCQVAIATNADRSCFNIKDAKYELSDRVDAVFSSHDFREPKEGKAFWLELHRAFDFDPATTLFVDDNPGVLAAAERFGIANNWCVRTPDSKRPTRSVTDYPALDEFAEICTFSA
tara:strand:- start:16202 stop:16891 length:690 start_codon:yes stop_codon:yes gene_type:complete